MLHIRRNTGRIFRSLRPAFASSHRLACAPAINVIDRAQCSQSYGVTISRRFYSSNPAEGGENGDQAPKSNEPPEEIETSLVQSEFVGNEIEKANIPEDFPDVPILAVSRYPLFPGFIKKVDITKDATLKKLIRKRVDLRQPYVGVFLKKDNDNRAEVMHSISDIHSVGTFAHILEMRENG